MVRVWWDHALAVEESRGLNALAGDWTDADSATWNARKATETGPTYDGP